MFRSRILKFVGMGVIVVLVLLLTMSLDRAAGAVLAAKTKGHSSGSSHGLLLPPGTHFRHVSAEFDYSVHVNRLGFRGAEFPLTSDTFRIAVIGDSYVYGWGVADDDTWPAVLERDLRKAGLAVAVANLGRPGEQPRVYADIAEKAVPILRPQLVIVGVLSGQDYAQEWWSTQTLRERIETASARELPTLFARKLRSGVERIGGLLYPTTLALLTRSGPASGSGTHTDITLEETRAALRQQASEVEQSFGEREKARFARLDTMMIRLFYSGDLNPATLYYSLKRPEYFQLTEQFSTERGKQVVAAMAAAFSRIQQVTKRYGGTTVVFSVPYMPYSGIRGCEAIQRLGYTCDSRMYTGDDADRATEAAAQQAGVAAYSVTNAIRSAEATRELYYPIDTHFNRSGYELFAHLTTPIVESLVDSIWTIRSTTPSR